MALFLEEEWSSSDLNYFSFFLFHWQIFWKRFDKIFRDKTMISYFKYLGIIFYQFRLITWLGNLFFTFILIIANIYCNLSTTILVVRSYLFWKWKPRKDSYKNFYDKNWRYVLEGTKKHINDSKISSNYDSLGWQLTAAIPI